MVTAPRFSYGFRMTNRPPPKISKWIFVAADLLMLAVFAWLVRYFLPPKTTGDYAIVMTLSTLWAYGAYICISPWLAEFKAQTFGVPCARRPDRSQWLRNPAAAEGCLNRSDGENPTGGCDRETDSAARSRE